jgi:hypothetical protein
MNGFVGVFGQIRAHIICKQKPRVCADVAVKIADLGLQRKRPRRVVTGPL